MPNYHLLSASIQPVNDPNTVIVREGDRAITLPELVILRALHGSDGVYGVRLVGEVAREDSEERERLLALYGVIVERTFPPHMPLPTEDFRLAQQAAQEAEKAALAARVEAEMQREKLAAMQAATPQPQPRASKKAEAPAPLPDPVAGE